MWDRTYINLLEFGQAFLLNGEVQLENSLTTISDTNNILRDTVMREFDYKE